MKKPKIRFSEYTNDWNEYTFGELIEEFNNKTKEENEDTLLSSAIEGMFLNSELFSHQRGSSTIGYKKIKKGTLILSAQNLHLGNANVNLRFESGIISPAYKTYNILQGDLEFWSHWIKRDETNKMFFDATTTGASQCRRNVIWDELYDTPVFFPNIEEQQKIAAFLTKVTQKISAQTELIKSLEKQKIALLESLLSQKIRFKKSDGSNYPDWASTTMQKCTYPSGRKNKENGNYESYSINNINGFVPQNEQFDGGTLEEADKSMYIIVSPNSFAYNPARINVGSIGYQNVGRDVIVSSLYEVFNTTDDCYDPFIWHWFHTVHFNNTVQRLAEGGVRQYFYYDKLCKAKIMLPSLEEQQKIADFLDLLDKKVELEKQVLNDWIILKKALYQQLFV